MFFKTTSTGDCNHDVHKITHSTKSERFGLYGCSIFLHDVSHRICGRSLNMYDCNLWKMEFLLSNSRITRLSMLSNSSPTYGSNRPISLIRLFQDMSSSPPPTPLPPPPSCSPIWPRTKYSPGCQTIQILPGICPPLLLVIRWIRVTFTRKTFWYII